MSIFEVTSCYGCMIRSGEESQCYCYCSHPDGPDDITSEVENEELHEDCPLRKGHVLIKLKQEEVEVV